MTHHSELTQAVERLREAREEIERLLAARGALTVNPNHHSTKEDPR